MTLLDLLLALLLLAAVRSGWRAGLLTRVSLWIGLVLGLLLSAWTVPLVLGWLAETASTTRFVIAVTTLAATVALVATTLGQLGASLGRVVARTPMARLDQAAGAVAGAALVVVGAWLVLPIAAAVPGTLGEQASGSRGAGILADWAPPPPDVSDGVGRLVAGSRFPEVIAELDPVRAAEPPPGDIAVDADVVADATAATVRVSASGCDARYDGSGVTVSRNHVLTNAHVVAGSDEVQIRRPDGVQLPGRVVTFDPDRDLAIIEVPELGQEPLLLGHGQARDEGVAIGYPGGQPDPRVAPVRIEQRRTALGRDIYGLDETEREVLFLASSLLPGDSGAPVVNQVGEVVGLVFAVNPDNDGSAYALDREEIDAVLAAPRVTGATGRCLQTSTAGAGP
jgi:S1-C subfamily serine protease